MKKSHQKCIIDYFKALTPVPIQKDTGDFLGFLDRRCVNALKKTKRNR